MSDQLAPLPKLAFVDSAGAPLVGGQLFTYSAGTTTKLATYTDSTGGTPNTNPIVLDSRGECNCWLPPGTAYKFKLAPSTDTDPPTNPIWTVDQITSGLASIPGGLDTGAANAYVATGIVGVSSTAAFTAVVVKIAHANGGASTLNVNGTGVLQIRDQAGAQLAANALLAGQTAFFVSDGTYWRYTYFSQSYNITAQPNITVAPTGNNIATLASLNIQTSTISATEREFLLCVGLDSSLGTGTNADKVGIYSGIVGHSGTANIWALNTVTEMAASSGTYVAQGYELDFNNNNVDVGATSFAAPAGYGLSISGAGSKLSTAAMLVSGPAAPIWRRGILFANYAVSDKTIEDQTNSTTVFLVEGIHTYGIDFANGVTTTPIRLGQAQWIKARNAADSADLTALSVSGTGATNNMLLGDTALAGIFANSGIFPNVTTSYNLGQPSNQWQTLYTVAVVASSRPDLKTNIQDAPSVLPILDALPIKLFQWKKGGVDSVEETEERLIQETTLEQFERETIEVVDGIARLVLKPETREELVFDILPVIGPDGRQVITIIPAKPAVKDKDGKVIKEAQPEHRIPRIHRVPRMVRKTVPVTRQVERPGRRLHLGAMAPDIRDAFAALGLDMAAFKQDGEEQGYQLDQIVWLALKGLQEERSARLALEARLTALENRP